jgi:hypothetical protein
MVSFPSFFTPVTLGTLGSAASLLKDPPALLAANDSTRLKLLRRGNILGKASDIPWTLHYPDSRYSLVAMLFCHEGLENTPSVKLVQCSDRSCVFRAGMEANTPGLSNLPRPTSYPSISKSQKAIPVSFINPAWLLLHFYP